MSKIALKGFCAARFWPVTVNDSTTYTTDTVVQFIGAQNLTKDENTTEYTIPGDDGVYDTGADYNYEEMEFEVNELPLLVQSQLKGGTYDEATSTYTFKKTDIAIEFAFAYAAKRADGEYRMWKHFLCKVMKIKVDHKTLGPDKKDIDTYKITIRNTSRLADGAVSDIRDSADKTYDWLNTIDNLPAA